MGVVFDASMICNGMGWDGIELNINRKKKKPNAGQFMAQPELVASRSVYLIIENRLASFIITS
jgi:hypothetical protein